MGWAPEDVFREVREGGYFEAAVLDRIYPNYRPSTPPAWFPLDLNPLTDASEH